MSLFKLLLCTFAHDEKHFMGRAHVKFKLLVYQWCCSKGVSLRTNMNHALDRANFMHLSAIYLSPGSLKGDRLENSPGPQGSRGLITANASRSKGVS